MGVSGGPLEADHAATERVADLVSAIDSRITVQNDSVASYPVARSSSRQRMSRELTPSQKRAVMLAQQQVLRAQQAHRQQMFRKAELAQLRRKQDEAFQQAITVRPASQKAEPSVGEGEISFRKILGEVLRSLRQDDHKTLREVSERAGVSLGYLSEVERGQKEASSELLGSISAALGKPLSQTLRLVADQVEKAEKLQQARSDSSVQMAA